MQQRRSNLVLVEQQAHRFHACHRRGGLCGNSGSSTLGSYQDAASERQMCALGLGSIGVTRQPSRSSSVGWPVRSATMCEPQREQNLRNFRGDDSNEFNSSSPLTNRKRSRGTFVRLEKAEPWVLRQGWEWEWMIGPRGGPPFC